MAGPSVVTTVEDAGFAPDTGGAAVASSLAASGQGFLAGGPVGAIIAGTSSLIKSLAQHTARLHDAINENQAADQAVPSYDADLLAIQEAYNAGTSSIADLVAACQTVDTNIFQFMYALHAANKPGTAWGGPTTAQIGSGLNPQYSAACNSACTVACCVYLNDLRPGIFGRSNGGTQLNKGVLECILNGGGIASIPGVEAPPSQYGNYSRKAYTLTFTPPKSIPASPLTIASIFSSTPTQGVPPSATTAPATATAAASTTAAATSGGILSAFTNNEIVAILTVVGGIILVVTALFGQNALRVDK